MAVKDETPTQRASGWLAALDAALRRGDSAAAAALFGEDSYWRDLVSFTWNITTAEGGAKICQMIEAAVNATKSLDQKALAKYLRENEHKTIVGPISFSADGERKETATLMAQFRGVVDKDIEQFRSSGKQVILFPDKLKSGNLISPFEAARK